jgi:hypothetical protein
VAVAGNSVVKRHLEYLFLGARDVEGAVFFAGIEPAIGEHSAVCCHEEPPFSVTVQRYIRSRADVK